MNKPFRRVFEAQGDDGLPIVVPDEPADVPVEQQIINRIDEVNAAADAADGGADTGDGSIGRGGLQGDPNAQEQGAQEDLILGRFKTNDDVIQAYQNLEPQYTQTRQQLRDYERQIQELQDQVQQGQYAQELGQDDDFEFNAPFSNNPTSVEELEALAEQYPDRAALFAINNANRLPQELVQEVVNYWHSRNPAQATAYMLQQMFQSYLPQVEQRLAPHDNAQQMNVVQSAVDAAEAAIGPEYDQYHNRIIDVMEANPAFLPKDTNDPEAMRDAIINVYSMLIGRDTLDRGKQLAAQGAPQPAQNQARTQTRPAAVQGNPNASEEDIEAARQIQQLILNAQG